MRKLIYILVILTIANILIGANYPDFKSIVQRQHEIRAQEKEYYARYWPEFTENTREMDNYDVLYYFIDIDIDFENEFGITGHELDRSGQKKHKPYVAFRTFFDADGNPIHEQFERIRNHPKWRLIVKSIYDIDLS